MKPTEEKVLGGLFGLSIGDALGVPVEGVPREVLKKSPVEDLEYPSALRDIPSGWWSDDSSLSFCLAESLCSGFDLEDIARSFLSWLHEGRWTPGGVAFGIGSTTYRALERIRQGVSPASSGGTEEYSNGNGSLMRILPLSFHLMESSTEERFEKTHLVSAITHAHPRSLVACGIYIDLALRLLSGACPESAYSEMQENAARYYRAGRFRSELPYFSRVLEGNISECDDFEIRSSGYVVDTLEASLFCFLKGGSFSQVVLKAVNLGGDSDTTGAVSGGIAGIYYGFRGIPKRWVDCVARKDDIIELAQNVKRSV